MYSGPMVHIQAEELYVSVPSVVSAKEKALGYSSTGGFDLGKRFTLERARHHMIMIDDESWQKRKKKSVVGVTWGKLVLLTVSKGISVHTVSCISRHTQYFNETS